MISISFFFFCLAFLSRPFTNYRTAGKGGGYFFNYSLPLPPASRALRHQPCDCCREYTSPHSQQSDSGRERLVSERRSLATELRALMGALLAGHWATRPQIWVSGKRSGNYLSSKTNLSAFLQICCSDFTLKLRQRSSSYKNCQKKRKKKKSNLRLSGMSWGQRMFPGAIVRRVGQGLVFVWDGALREGFGSCFWRDFYQRFGFCFSREFYQCWRDDWVRGNNPIGLRNFVNIY